mmetsp:Transcript_11491/g.30998  ORF Transcript_11491/g.30998 Transcript_11491/m.30998 type:complete len:135 (+) Transcript_11491:57-461(+)|eukprot:CAMPEP_0185184788 /NCGR_PEP_ID=MMETSP1140-20130426/2770_1 /TAXON_ID=298111 /ORGANISM="Pavlova sp., Strain CCMP459" /LENGTH=134 /DNA_ID=CAMNT_0027750871 /DNA_START=42 /DNA_END=446 /DNA_ORIENTATION=-
MPAKKKKGGGKKKAKKEEDGPKAPVKQFCKVEVVNATWKSMRFVMQMSTDERLSTVVAALRDRHQVGMRGLRLYYGEIIVEEASIDIEADPTLADIGVTGGTKLFDDFKHILTYDFPPYRRSVLNLPTKTSFIM